MNRGSPAEPGSRALDASRAFIQRYLRPLRRIKSAGLQHVWRIIHWRSAGFADQSHQPLRQNAIQRGDEVVGLDTHVQEAPNHVHHIVGVNRGKDQVTRQRGLNSDLRCLRVANFADHDFVRVMARSWYSTGSSMVMILSSSVLISFTAA